MADYWFGPNQLLSNKERPGFNQLALGFVDLTVQENSSKSQI